MISHPNLKRNIPQTKKQRLFRLFHILITEYNISHYFYSTLIIIQMLQMIYFSIHYSCCDIWSFSGVNIVQEIFGFLQGSLAWQFSSNFMLIIFNCIVFTVYMIAAIDIIYQVINATPELIGAKDNFHEIRIKYLQYLSTLTRQVLQIPLISLTTLSIKNSLKLSSSLQIGLMIVSVLAFIFYLLMGLLFLQLFIDNSPFSKFSLSWSINNNQKYKAILKCVIGIAASLLPSKCEPQSYAKIVHLAFLVAIMMGFLYLSYLNYIQPNIIHNSVRKMYEHTNITLAAVYFMIFLQKIIAPGENITILYLFIFCLMINFAWQRLKQRRQESLIFRVYKTLTTKNQILSYNYLMCQYIRDFSESPLCLIKLEGILSDHIFTCKKIDHVCKCRTLRQKLRRFQYSSDMSKVRKQQQLWFQFVKQNLLYNTQKMNHLPQFHLLLSYIEMIMLNNSFLSYANLQKCNKKNMNISIEFLIYRQKRIIEKTLRQQDIKNNEKKQVDVNKYITMSDQIQDFQQKVLMSSLEHLEYWKKFGGSHKKSKSTIMKQGSKLVIAVKDCQQAYKKINQKYPNNLQSIVLFSNYSKYILNNHELIHKNRRVFNSIKKKLFRAIKISPQQQKQKYSQNSVTGSIIISGQKQNIGTIKMCSSKVTKILKYAPYQLVGQNVNTLMPNFIGNMHNQVLCKYLEQSSPQSNFVQRYIPMIDKNNFMILSRIMTKPLPSLINGLQIIGLIEKVRQNHIRHQNQVPKYMLYRCDTGNIQALSQNFYSHYGYRLMKVNQYSQISEELVFGSIFNDIHDSHLNSDQEGLECQIKLKNGSKKSTRVRAYIRNQFYYFKIKIRLLYIFSCTLNNLMINNAVTINVAPSNLALSQKNSSEVNGNTHTPKSIDANPKQTTQTLSQQQLKQLQVKTPLKLRIFQIILLIFMMLIISLSIVQFYFDLDKISILKNFHEHSHYTSMSLLNLINVGYYARMMHLSANKSSDVLNFDWFKSNVSKYTDNLQKAEFWLVNKELQSSKIIDLSFDSSALSWKINQKSVILPTTQSLSLSIFDLVTSSSSFESASKSSFNFSFNLIQGNISAKTNSYYRNLFRIRYSSLFQLLSMKQEYSNQIMIAYSKKLENYRTYGKILIGLACSFIILSLFSKIRIVYVILNSIYGITTLFNWLTPGEIQKQVERCQNFLQHFFIYYYQVVLRLKKNQILRGHSFGQEKLQLNRNNRFMKTMTYQLHQNLLKNKIEGVDSPLQSDNQLLIDDQYANDEIDLVKLSDKCIKNKQGQKNKDQILMQQKTPLNQQQQMIQTTLDVNQEEQGFCFENINAFTPIIFGYVFIFAHFLIIFLSDEVYFVQAQAQISTQSFIYKNIQVLDMLKYYGLENAVDNAKFQNYPNLSEYFNKYNLEIYRLQKQMNTFTNSRNFTPQIMNQVEDLNKNGICSGNFTESLSYLTSSFDIDQCKFIDNGILTQGLRASIVAYIQNIRNTTNITDINAFLQSESFIRTLKLDKYLKSAMFFIINTSTHTSNTNIDNENKLKIAQFSFFIFFAILVIFLINWKNSENFNNQILGSYQIITLIPQRIFEKNVNLCAQYRKNVKQLLQ